ncbi:MAG: hypothetical protein ABFE08_09940 [Armatimonadia bacterium]
MRVTMVVLAVLAATLAGAVILPHDCLWIEDGQVQVQGAGIAAPPELAGARNVELLKPLRDGLLAWTTEARDDTGNLIEFSLNLANVRTGENRRLLKGLDPFGEGTDWTLQRVQLTASGKALLLRIRLSGAGGFVSVYKLLLTPPYIMHPVNEETLVWDDVAADGSLKATPTWELTPDWQQAPAEREARYGSIIVAGKTTPQGRLVWQIGKFSEIPDWADRDITGVATAPDLKRIAYTNARGVWLVGLKGEPQSLFAAGEAEGFGDPVWHPDGSGVFVTRNLYLGDGSRRSSVWFVPADGLGQREVVKAQGRGFCLVR